MKKTLILLTVILFTGCATVLEYDRTALEPVPFEPLVAELQISQSYVRVDIDRSISTSTGSFSNTRVIGTNADGTQATSTSTSTYTSSSDVPYSLAALGLGNGMYLDASGNLYFDPAEMFGISDYESLSDDTYTYTRTGNSFQNARSGLFGNTERFVPKGGGYVLVNDKGEEGNMTIGLDSSMVYERTRALLGNRYTDHVLERGDSEGRFEYYVRYGVEGTQTDDEGSLRTIFQVSGDSLTASEPALFGNIVELFTLVVAGNEIQIFYDSDVADIVVERYVDQYVIRRGSKNGSIIRYENGVIEVYEVTSPDLIEAIFGGNKSTYQIEVVGAR